MDEEKPAKGLGLQEMLMAVDDEERTELDKVLENMFDPENIGHLSDLNSREILVFSVLDSLSTKYPLPALRRFLEKNLVLRVSKGRGGRKDLVKIFSRALQQDDMENTGGFGRWFGRGGGGPRR